MIHVRQRDNLEQSWLKPSRCSHSNIRRSTVKIFFAYAGMLFVVLASVPVHAASGLVLYDNFDGANIDPTKWVGSEAGDQGRESFRAIKSHQLRLGYIGYCDTTSGSDSIDCEGSVQLHFTTPGVTSLQAITAIQATITPLQASTPPCSSNTFPTTAGVELLGFFFNTGAPTPGSHVNDVRA